MEKVILVDELDNQVGTMEKLEAHRRGVLHRAFSVFTFNDEGDLLLQKRASQKYHSGGLWTNTCCSHPRENENTLDAAYRRLMEEMGFHCKLEKKFDFIYHRKLDNNLIEHEYDHVYFGKYNDQPRPNPEEVEDWKFMSLSNIRSDIAAHPYQYTEWFKICMERIAEYV